LTFGPAGEDAVSSRKRKRLDAIALTFQQKWGAPALRRGEQLGPPAPVAKIATGFASLDRALVGIYGIPRGHITEFIGAPTSGMATLALRLIAQAQAERDMAAYLDLGATFDPDYAHRCGVSLAKLLLVRPRSGGEGLEMARSLLAGRGVGVLVVDSLAHLLAGPPPAPAWRQLSRALAQSPAAAIFLTQLSSNKALFPQHYPGTSPLPHYAALRLLFSKERWLYRGQDIKGYQARIQVIKNRLGQADQVATIRITFNGTVKGDSA
jgi:RecA/RadA recombinase